MTPKERNVLRELAKELAEIAHSPVQEEKRRLWRKLNAKKPDRPMVMMEQVCWNEMNVGDELTLRCEEPELRGIEHRLRSLLYQWRHFRVDMVVEGYYEVPKAIQGLNTWETVFGISVEEKTLHSDSTNDVQSHHYLNQFQTMEDVEKIKMPEIWHDEMETNRRLGIAEQLFDGILEVRTAGWDPYLSIWDPVTSLMGANDLLYMLVDNPDLMHAIAKRMSDGYMCMLDQLEEQGLLCQPQPTIHATGAWTDELPGKDYDPDHPLCKSIWMFGLAQIFSSCSPSMFEEFEIHYSLPIFERFGMVYYGCCDPLDGKMEQVRKIPHCRKVSMSPWVNKERGAEEIHGDE